jgi:hypothetical protein
MYASILIQAWQTAAQDPGIEIAEAPAKPTKAITLEQVKAVYLS